MTAKLVGSVPSEPGITSAIIRVPALVPSLIQGSVPCTPSVAAK